MRDLTERRTTYIFPFVTIILIVVNFLIFFSIQFLNNPIKQTDPVSLLQCISNNYPQCIEKVTDDKKIFQCGFEIYHQKIDPKVCLYDIKDQCLANGEVVQQCFSFKQAVSFDYGFSPYKFQRGSFLPLITAMFLHSDFFHVLANMVSLLLVGTFVEARLGRVKYLLLYILTGIGASLAFFIADQNSVIPGIGASGAIFGLMGASLVLNFHRPVEQRISKIHKIGFDGFSTPYLIISFLIQILYGTFGGGGNIGFSAHIGGFIAGFILIFYLKDKTDHYWPDPVR